MIWLKNPKLYNLDFLLIGDVNDGYVERGISIDGEAHDEWVKGYPAIIYSTVEEDIINDQEKSRFLQKQFIIIWITLQMLVFCIKFKGEIWKAKKYCPLMKSIIVLIKVLTKCALAEINLTTAE